MNKKKSKVLAFLLATAMIVPTANGTIYAATDLKNSVSVQQAEEKDVNTKQSESQYVAMIEQKEYKTLQEAFNAVPTDGKQVRIVMQNNITDMKTADIATLEKGKNIVLDMNGKSITVASDFNGRPIKNYGTMIITGNGTISAKASSVGGYGAIDNYGKLTIENGTYSGSVDADGSSIRTRKGSETIVKDGNFLDASSTFVNAGVSYIYGGKFITESCNSCGLKKWGYSLRSIKDDGDYTPELYVYDAYVEGVQGGIAIAAGYGEIYGGIFKTVNCKNYGGNPAFYSIYVAGESGKAKCKIYGGEFTSASKQAINIGNNTIGDGGLRENANAVIYGGTFKAGNSQAVETDKEKGSINISGGIFLNKDNTKSLIEENWIPSKDGNKLFIQNEDGSVVMSEHNENKDCTLTKVEAKAPTCRSEGNIKYYVCENHGLYKDASHSDKINENDTKLAKLPHVFGEWTVEGEIKTRKCTTCDETETMSAGVASVDGKAYETLDEAIKAAMSGENKTVKLLSDIKADTWNQIWNIKGITLDGNGKTIKVKKIESLENHDAVLHSAGGNTFKNLTIDLSEVEKGKAQGIRAISASTGDVIDNVTIIGGKNASYGITAGSSCKNLTVKNSNISNCGHGVYLEGANDATVLIKDNTFDGCEYASILYSKNATFEGNTVKGGKVNIMHESNVVQKNTFTQDNDGKASRVKFYTKGNEKTFKYNKLVEGKDGKIGSTITFATGKNPVNPGDVDFSLNYLGDKDKFDEIIEGATSEEIVGIKDQAFNEPSDVDKYLNGGSSTPSIPSKPIKPTYDHTSIIGSDRYDTAGKIADKLGSYDTAVLVNATSTMSDGLSAAGLAGKEDAAILLVKKDSIPKATMDRLKKVKKVYIIGGENAISKKVSDEITKNVAKVEVERLGGKTRVETSELVAKEIGSYKKAFVVNGFKGEADAMSASSVAAREEAPILLTNGKTSTHAKKSDVKYYVVGGKNVMNNAIADKYNAEIIAGDDRYETNREMVNEFYGASETLYFANGETLVDALTASTIAKDDGLVLVGRKSDNKILNKKNTIQVGGMKFEVDFEK